MNRILVILFFSLLSFSSFSQQNYYWTGGSGNWSDVSHWVDYSGSVTNHTVPPSNTNNVYFDTNSFNSNNDTVKLDVNAFCKGIFYNQPDSISFFNFNGKRLTISDESRWDSSVTMFGNGNVIFNASSSGVGIQAEGVIFPDTVTFDGSGSWQLNDSIKVAGPTFIDQGELRSNSMKLTLYDFHLASNGKLKLDESVVDLSGDWNMNGSVDLDADEATIYINNNNTSFWPTDFYGGDEDYGKLVISGSVKIMGDNAFDTLELGFPSAVFLDIFDTQTINDKFFGGCSSCCGYSVLASTNSGNNANIILPGNDSIFNTIISDIEINGDTLFAGSNCIDMGGNSFVNFNNTNPNPDTLYWIGDSGNWQDCNNWSLSSGGAPSGFVPSLIDSVVFDDASFTVSNRTVTVTGMAYCDGLRISTSLSKKPTIDLDKGLTIHGSLDVSGSVTFEGDELFFVSSNSETIDLGENRIEDPKVDLYFRGSGSYELRDSLSIEGYIQIHECDFSSEGNLIRTEYLSITGNDPATVELGESEVYIASEENFLDLQSSDFTLEANKANLISTYTGSLFHIIDLNGNSLNIGRLELNGTTSFENIGNLTVGKIVFAKKPDTTIFYFDSTVDTLTILEDILLKDSGKCIINGALSNKLVLNNLAGPLCLNDALMGLIDVAGPYPFYLDIGCATCFGITITNSACYRDISGTVYLDNTPQQQGQVLLFDVLQEQQMLDTISVADLDSSGHYQIDSVKLGHYYLLANPDNVSNAFSTYFGDTLLWNGADILYLDSANTGSATNINLVSAPTAMGGNSKIEGVIKEGNSILRGPGDPLQGVIISLYNLNSNDVVGVDQSDSLGGFTFDGVSAGDYSVIPDVTGVPVDTSGLNHISLGSNADTVSIDFTVDSNLIYPDNSVVVSIKKENNQLKVKVYPNPVNSKNGLNVSGAEGAIAVLYDMQGKRVDVRKVSGKTTNFAINSAMTFYILKLTLNDKTYNYKIIVN